MSVEEIAHGFTRLCQAGEFTKAKRQYYATHVEALTDAGVIRGLDLLLEQNQLFDEQHPRIGAVSVIGPYTSRHSRVFTIVVNYEMVPAPEDEVEHKSEMWQLTVGHEEIIREQHFYL